jgi:hypothetical protein
MKTFINSAHLTRDVSINKLPLHFRKVSQVLATDSVDIGGQNPVEAAKPPPLLPQLESREED